MTEQELDLCNKCFEENGNNCIQGLDGPEVPDGFLHNCRTLKSSVRTNNLERALTCALEHFSIQSMDEEPILVFTSSRTFVKNYGHLVDFHDYRKK